MKIENKNQAALIRQEIETTILKPLLEAKRLRSDDYDTWGDKHRAECCKLLAAMYNYNDHMVYGGYGWQIDFTRGGGIGMGEYPDSLSINAYCIV